MIREDVRRFAEDPGAYGELEPESGLRRMLTDRYCLLLGPVPSFTTVSTALRMAACPLRRSALVTKRKVQSSVKHATNDSTSRVSNAKL